MTQEQNDNALPGLDDQQDGNGDIVRAIEENTRVLHDIKAALELLAESMAANGKTTPRAPECSDVVDECIRVYKACPDTGLFARVDVINALGFNLNDLSDSTKKRLSDSIVLLAEVGLLARVGEKAQSRYMKVPNMNESVAREKILSAEFRAAARAKHRRGAAL